MSDEQQDEDTGEGGGARRKVSGKKLILFILLPVLVLLGAGVGVYMSGLLDPVLGLNEKTAEAEQAEADEAAAQPGHFHELDEMTVTLRSQGSKTRFLKLQLTLELESEADAQRIEEVMPRIKDNFQVFLRELRVAELEGSEGVYRIREELLSRVNDAAAPVEVKDVLFTDMLIQ